MVETRGMKQGLKLKVNVSRTAKKRNDEAFIEELNQIASQLMVTYDEIEKQELSQQPTFDDIDEEECGLDVQEQQALSESISSQYWSGLLSLNADLLSNILSSLDIPITSESQEPYSPIYEILCEVNNPLWEVFDSLNCLLSDTTTAAHFHRICCNPKLISVLSVACQNNSQA